MSSFVTVSFRRMQPQPSIEAAVHRWVARLEGVRVSIIRAAIDIEQANRKQLRVCATVMLADGAIATATCLHVDPYVAVGDTFRALRRGASQAQAAA